MPPEAAFSLRILILATVVTIALIGAIHWLSRRWYIRRNDGPRAKSYANRFHLTIRYIFSGLFLAGTILVNVFREFFEPSLYVVFLLFYALYTAISVHMWKKKAIIRTITGMSGSCREGRCLWQPLASLRPC